MSRPRHKKNGSPRLRRPVKPQPPRAPREWVLFCDEAGNAGSNWLDTAQPYHVAAGWLVRAPKRQQFEDVMRDAANGTQAPELKGATLLRRPSGVRTIVDVLRRLGAFGMPLFVIADRAFCIAGKAVEAFLDPVTNPRAEWLPTGALHRRQTVWETVSALPEPILTQFARAYRQPTADTFREAAAAIAGGLRAQGADERLADTFDAATTKAAEICAYETHGSEDAGHGLITALNAPLFLHLAKKADRLLDMYPGAKMLVVHDEIARFDRVFARALRSVRFAPDAGADFFGPDGEFVRFGVKHVAQFEVSASTAAPGIQAADLLAASVARLARDARAGEAWSDDLYELGALTLPALLTNEDGDDPPFAGMMGHRDELARILRPLFRKGTSATE